MRRDRQIRRLNDNARGTFVGCLVVLSYEVGQLPLDIRAHILLAVQAFRDFDEPIDTNGTHELASLRVKGHELYFRMEYEGDPADPCTLRILRIFTLEEYPHAEH